MGQNRRTPLTPTLQRQRQRNRKRKTERGEITKERETKRERRTEPATLQTKKATHQSQRGRRNPERDGDTPWAQEGRTIRQREKSGTGSTRTARTNRTNKLPIRGQQVQPGHIFE